MQLDNVYRLAAKVFTRTRRPVPDIERGEEPRLPRLELTDIDFGGVLDDLSNVPYGSRSPSRQSANVQPTDELKVIPPKVDEPITKSPFRSSSLRLTIEPAARLLETRVDLSEVVCGPRSPSQESIHLEPLDELTVIRPQVDESPIQRSSLRLTIEPAARLLETRGDLREVACGPRSPSQESSHLEPPDELMVISPQVNEPLTKSPFRSSPLSPAANIAPAAQLPEAHAGGQEVRLPARRMDTSRSLREQPEYIVASVISDVNSDLEEINRKESRWWGIDVCVAALIPLVRSKQKERYASFINKIMNKAAELMPENSDFVSSEEADEMVEILQRKLADWFTDAVKPGRCNLFGNRILANFNKVFGAEFKDLRAESNRGRSRIVKPIGSGSQLESLAAQSLKQLRPERTPEEAILREKSERHIHL
jgi:hypothetical protein